MAAPPDPADAARPTPPRFVVDAHLGRLAKYLRMLGFDAIYGNDHGDPLLASLAQTEKRILLSRDRKLLEWSAADDGYFVQATDPEERLVEVIKRFDLAPHVKPFTRCLKCNAPLQEIEKADVLGRLPPRTAEHFDTFYYCPTCDQVLWRGSHYDRMERFIARILSAAAAS